MAEYRKSTEDDTLNLENDTLNDTINIPPDLTAKEKAVLDAMMAHGDGVSGS